ncbi:MAG: PAS domain-containing protein [Deltaproteobacteria bacterium]|nr:PAS domain-containing protein [Deltaproteobacteria bacterium]
MSLRMKILGGFGVSLGLTFLVCLWAVGNLADLGSASEKILRENYRSIEAAHQMSEALERQDKAVLGALWSRKAAAADSREAESQFLQWLGRAKANVTLPGEARVLEGLSQAYAAYRTATAELAQAPDHAPAVGIQAYDQRIVPLYRQVRDLVAQLGRLNRNSMFALADQARSLAHRAVWSTLGVGGAAILLGLLFSLALSLRLTRPLQRLIAATAEIGAGRYDLDLPKEAGDELGRLTRGFAVMAKKLAAFHELNVGRLLAEKLTSEAIIHSVHDGLLVVDPELKVVGLNPAAARALSLEPGRALGRHVLEAVGDRGLMERIRRAVEGEGGEAGGELGELTSGPPEEAHHYNLMVTPARTEKGRLVGAVVLFQDVTKLRALDRLKSQFVMNASHELRTPVTGLLLSLDSLLESTGDRLPSADRELLAAAREEAQRLRELVDELLNLSLLESGRLEMHPAPVTAAGLAAEALAILTPQAREKGVELVNEVPADLPPAWADHHKMVWVFTNLLANALRYSPPASRIEVGGRGAGDHLELWVADQGPGIPVAQQAHIFDKFVQIGQPSRQGGAGLGLALCRELVNANHGAIWLHSQPGQGARFTFSLPLAPGRGREEES